MRRPFVILEYGLRPELFCSIDENEVNKLRSESWEKEQVPTNDGIYEYWQVIVAVQHV